MKYSSIQPVVFFIFLLFTINTFSQTTEKQDKEAIISVLNTQQKAWSEHNLEGFMQGYWKSDSLKFYGKNGLTLGWKNTLNNYIKNYPTKDHSGELSFKITDITKINDGAYFVMGAFYLTRKLGDANGIFMIIFKKINGKWKIIADTSS